MELPLKAKCVAPAPTSTAYVANPVIFRFCNVTSTLPELATKLTAVPPPVSAMFSSVMSWPPLNWKIGGNVPVPVTPRNTVEAPAPVMTIGSPATPESDAPKLIVVGSV